MATVYSLFQLTDGHHPWKGTEPYRMTSNVPEATKFVETLSKIRLEAILVLTSAAEKMKRSFDKGKTGAREYQTGDSVWLDATNIKTTRATKKLDAKRLGPFKVIEKKGSASYKLELPLNWKIYPVFHESKLFSYFPPLFPFQQNTTNRTRPFTTGHRRSQFIQLWS